MSTNAFLQSVKRASDLFLKAGIREHYNSNISLPKDYVSQVRDLTYFDLWSIHNDSFWYHIKLHDQSLILFFEDSFKYIATPFENMGTLEEYEKTKKQELYDNNFSKPEIDTYLEDIIDEYQKYLETESKFGSYTPIRVDIHPDQYNRIYHPLTHLHIGHANESRIPIKRIMTPHAFSGFILSIFYPKIWKTLRDKKLINDDEFKSLNVNLPLTNHEYKQYWCKDEEEMRFYLI